LELLNFNTDSSLIHTTKFEGKDRKTLETALIECNSPNSFLLSYEKEPSGRPHGKVRNFIFWNRGGLCLASRLFYVMYSGKKAFKIIYSQTTKNTYFHLKIAIKL
jgi:hypothetical protein